MGTEVTHECNGPGGGVRVAVIFTGFRGPRDKVCYLRKRKETKGQASEMQSTLTGRSIRRRLVSRKARQERASVQRGAEVGAGGRADRPRKEHFLPRKATRPPRREQAVALPDGCLWLLPSFCSPHPPLLYLSLSLFTSIREILVRRNNTFFV